MSDDMENSHGSGGGSSPPENSPLSSTTYSMPLEGVLSYGVSTFIPWSQAASSNTYSLPEDEGYWEDLAKIGKPVIAMVVGWALGCATGALGVIWVLSR